MSGRSHIGATHRSHVVRQAVARWPASPHVCHAHERFIHRTLFAYPWPPHRAVAAHRKLHRISQSHLALALPSSRTCPRASNPVSQVETCPVSARSAGRTPRQGWSGLDPAVVSSGCSSSPCRSSARRARAAALMRYRSEGEWNVSSWTRLISSSESESPSVVSGAGDAAGRAPRAGA